MPVPPCANALARTTRGPRLGPPNERAYSPPVHECDEIGRLLEARGDVRLAYVFGSFAAGRTHAASDIDVAVLFTGKPPPATLDRLTEDLEEVAGRTVDLVDLASAPPLLRHQIVSTGSCVVCRDPAERADFETRTVMRYLDTAHLRKIQHHYLRERARVS